MRTKLKTNNKFENAKLGQLTLSRGTLLAKWLRLGSTSPKASSVSAPSRLGQTILALIRR